MKEVFKEKSILAIFLNNERRVKKLYKIYSVKFLEHKKLWRKLILEEDEHVKLLNELKEKFGESNKYFEVNEYSMEVLEYVGRFVEDELEKIKNKSKEVNIIQAIEAALSLEQSMAERKSFEMFNPSEEDIKKVFNKINKDTKKHKKTLEKAYDKALKSIYKKRKIKSAARVVLFDDKNKTAIINVRDGEYYKIPGGGMEKGESPEEAAKREALEEAGCKVELLNKIGEHEFVDPDQKYNMIYHSVCYLAKKVGDSSNPSFDDWEKSNNFKLIWVTYDEAVKLFESSETEDTFGYEINKRDLYFLKKGIEIFINK